MRPTVKRKPANAFWKSTRRLLIGAMNATLEWFDPHRGNIDDLASQYADTVLLGILAEAPAA
jgi:hypothetical protein